MAITLLHVQMRSGNAQYELRGRVRSYDGLIILTQLPVSHSPFLSRLFRAPFILRRLESDYFPFIFLPLIEFMDPLIRSLPSFRCI